MQDVSSTSSFALLSTLQNNYQQLTIEKITWILVSLLIGLHLLQFCYFYWQFDEYMKNKDKNKDIDKFKKFKNACIFKNLLLNSELFFRIYLFLNSSYFVIYGYIIFHLIKYKNYKKSIQHQLYSSQLQQKNPNSSNLCAKTLVTSDPVIEKEISWILYILSGLIAYSGLRFFYLLSYYKDIKNSDTKSCNNYSPYITNKRFWYILQAFIDFSLNGMLMACIYLERQHMRDIFAEQQTEKAIACLP